MGMRAGWVVQDVDSSFDIDAKRMEREAARKPEPGQQIDVGKLLGSNGWTSTNGGQSWKDPHSKVEMSKVDAAVEQLMRLGYSDEDIKKALI